MVERGLAKFYFHRCGGWEKKKRQAARFNKVPNEEKGVIGPNVTSSNKLLHCGPNFIATIDDVFFF